MIAALGVWGTANKWADLIVAAIMAGLFLTSSFQILRQSSPEFDWITARWSLAGLRTAVLWRSLEQGCKELQGLGCLEWKFDSLSSMSQTPTLLVTTRRAECAPFAARH